MTNEPANIRRARFPDEYGAPASDELIPWSHVEERLQGALNYWLSSVGPNGRPHARPVDGVWVEGALCFGGSPETRWVRNLLANPAVSVNLASEQEAIILEGRVEQITDAEHPLAAATAAASAAKYPQYQTEGSSEMPLVPFWVLRPTRVFAWTLEGFPNRATRWRFERK